MKKLFSFLLLNFVVYVLQAQIQDPVKFKTELKSLSDTEAEIVFTATIDKGWHVYSTELGDGGPISATFNVDSKSGIEPVGKLKPVGKEIAAFDKLFEMKVRYFENTAKFIQKVKFTGGAYAIDGYLEYGACNDESCLRHRFRSSLPEKLRVIRWRLKRTNRLKRIKQTRQRQI